MIRFEQNELDAAREYAQKGGQAFHVHRFNFGHPVFRKYPEIAHLFDQNVARLITTCRSLGVRVIKVEKINTPSQHIDLCGKPFERAKLLCVPRQTASL